MNFIDKLQEKTLLFRFILLICRRKRYFDYENWNLMRRYFLLIVLFYSFVFGQKENILVQKIRDNQTLMKSNMDKGYKELLPLEKQANKENNTKAKLEVLNNKAFFYFTQAQYNKAYKYARQLEKEASEIKDIRLIAIAMNRVGITLNFLGAYNEAEKNYYKLKSILKKINLKIKI